MKMSKAFVFFALVFSAAAVFAQTGKVTRVALTDGKTDAKATGIAVSGNDVYVAGWVVIANGNRIACYWKNGIQVALTDGKTNAAARAITISGNDVYVAGWVDFADNDSIACYWKNGTRIELTDRDDFGANAWAVTITVSGSDVYVGGYDDTAGLACYWKNGTQTVLAMDRVDGITVSGSDIYIVGKINRATFYWKNGFQTLIDSGNRWMTMVYGIAVSGKDMYVTGSSGQDGMMPWYEKNGNRVDLTRTMSSYPVAITLSGNDVYIAGFGESWEGSGISKVCYWKNGTYFTLSDEKTFAVATSIAVSGSDVYVAGYEIVAGWKYGGWLTGNKDSRNAAVYWKVKK